MSKRTPRHTPDERDKRIIRALLVENLRPADIARNEGVSRERIRQLLARLGITIRPAIDIQNPQLIAELCPEWGQEE